MTSSRDYLPCHKSVDGQFPLFVDSEDDLRDLKQPPPPKKGTQFVGAQD
ncbi:unnamed protein product [Caenorhabditis angaria]|uniref:Uncharacterized protein n=1 Tax=Caenorhabditis angaria TaxID=860376 RepID=A0A9P1MUL0_9PELO|nr:unnamed protein product [Caenorhabditis angaria]